MSKDFKYDENLDKCLWHIDVVTYKDSGYSISLMSYNNGPQKLAIKRFYTDKTGQRKLDDSPKRIPLSDFELIYQAVSKHVSGQSSQGGVPY